MYLEVLLGILLLAIVAGGVVEGFAAASSQIGKTRLDVVASKLALQHLEDIRTMSYSTIGTVGGNPPGAIPATQTQTVNGIAYTVQSSVKYVDNPAIGQPHTYVDYKSVTVVVTPALALGFPGHRDDDRRTAQLRVDGRALDRGRHGRRCRDAPTAAEHDRHDRWRPLGDPYGHHQRQRHGRVRGPDPEPHLDRQPAVQLHRPGRAGRVRDRPDDRTERDHRASERVADRQVTIKVFVPATLGVNLVDSVTGVPITNFSTVTVTAPAPQSLTDRPSGTVGTYTFTTLQGQVIEPSLSAFGITATADCYASQSLNTAVPAGYPNLTSQTVTFKMVSQGGGHLNATVVDNTTGQPIVGAQVQLSGGQNSLAPVVRTTNASGSVTFCEPPSGSTNYTVAAGANGYGAGSMSAAVTNNATTSVTLRLVAGTTGTIKLTTTSSNTLVRLKASAGTYDVSQYTNSSRYASFINLAPGTYTAYIATAFSSGNPIWNAGKTVTARSGQTLSYSVP